VTSDVVLSVTDLRKTYKKQLGAPGARRVDAVRGISFEVRRGEIFGFLGPNGAGKTTTIKMLTGLIAPTGGTATILGDRAPSPEAMRKVGFLPENPYVYPYLTPREFVSMCGRLSGVAARDLFARVEETIARVGIAGAIDRPVRALSKGMLQRAGLAAALVHRPELLILDEPMSGLDPVGRKEVRDLIIEERESGRTVFFSSHILSDVEMLCDRVCILRGGEVVVSGRIGDLLANAARVVDVTLGDVSPDLRDAFRSEGRAARDLGASLVLEIPEADVGPFLTGAIARGARVESVIPRRETLEQIFVRRAL